MSGDFATLGNEMYRGYQVAQDFINADGGINGRPIEFKVSDAPTPDAAVSIAQQLSTDPDVAAILGSYSSAIAIPASAVASRNGKPYFETGGVSAEITNRGLPLLYRTVVSTDLPGYVDATKNLIEQILAPALDKEPGELRIALTYETGAQGEAAAAALKDLAATQGYQIVADEAFEGNANDLSSVIQRLKSSDPDILYAVPTINSAILLTKQSEELGFTPPLTLGYGNGYTSPDFVAGVGDLANGIVVADAIPAHISDEVLSPDLSPTRSEFVDAFTEKFDHEPLTHATLGYLGAMVLFQDVLPNVDDLKDAASVDKAAKAVDIPDGGTVGGMGVKFDPETGQNVRAGWYVMQYQDKILQTIYPAELSTHEVLVSGK